MIKVAYEQQEKTKEFESKWEDQKKILSEMKKKLLFHMIQQEKTSYKSPHGTVKVADEFSVPVPKNPESKAAFFAWLKEEQIFDSVITVHSKSMGSIYKNGLLKSGDPEFRIPGLDEARTYKTIKLNK
jgi:hypothetical protein